DRQTATSEVLRVISSSPGELQPVFEAMLANAIRLCQAKFGNLLVREGDAFRIAALHGAPTAYAERWRRGPTVDLRGIPHTPLARVAGTKAVVHISDLAEEPAYIERRHPRMGRPCRICRRAHISLRADAKGRRVGWRHRDLPAGGPPVHRQADRAGNELRAAGRHCHREQTPTQ